MGLDERNLLLAQMYISDRLAQAAQMRLLHEATQTRHPRERVAARIGALLIRTGRWLEAAGGAGGTVIVPRPADDWGRRRPAI